MSNRKSEQLSEEFLLCSTLEESDDDEYTHGQLLQLPCTIEVIKTRRPLTISVSRRANPRKRDIKQETKVASKQIKVEKEKEKVKQMLGAAAYRKKKTGKPELPSVKMQVAKS